MLCARVAPPLRRPASDVFAVVPTRGANQGRVGCCGASQRRVGCCSNTWRQPAACWLFFQHVALYYERRAWPAGQYSSNTLCVLATAFGEFLPRCLLHLHHSTQQCTLTMSELGCSHAQRPAHAQTRGYSRPLWLWPRCVHVHRARARRCVAWCTWKHTQHTRMVITA